MSTWHIELTPANSHQLNDVLNLSQIHKPFRKWFGVLAGEIFKSIHIGLQLPLARPKVLNKTEAQHILIEAAMIQQQCLHHYRVYQDLKIHQAKDLALHDLLLFIRMSHYHPNEMDLMDYQEHSHVIESDDHLKHLLHQLQEQRLIQKIHANNRIFYDKNPYPHCHLLDTKTGRISDYDCHLNTLHNKRFKRIPHVSIECG